MANGDNKGVESFTESVWLRLISRFAMIAATIALPIVGWMVQRGVSTVDDISVKVEAIRERTLDMHGTVKMIQQTQALQSQILADHEARMRSLERLTPMLPPR